MARTKDLLMGVGVTDKNLNRDLGKVRKKFARNFQEIGRLGKKMSMSLSLPLAALGASSAKAFVGFEHSMQKVKAVSGATGAEFSALTEQAKALGASTVFTASQVAELQLNLSKLGFTASEIDKATESILNLAQATDSDLGTAADVVGSTLRQFAMDTSETGHLADVMAASFSTSALEIGSFSQAMGYVGPIAKTAGVSLEETTSMLAILANNGIRGSKAGRALRRILADLGKTGKPVAEAIKDMAEKGLGLEQAMDEVGRSAQTQLLILAENIDLMPGLTEQFENSDGAAAKMAGTMNEKTQGALKRLSSAVEGAQIAIGEGLAPTINALARTATKMVSAFSGLSQRTKNFVMVVGTLVAVMGPMLVLLPSIAAGFALIGTAVAAASGPLGLIALLVGGVVAVMSTFGQETHTATKEVRDQVLALEELSDAQLAEEGGTKIYKDLSKSLQKVTRDHKDNNRRLQEAKKYAVDAAAANAAQIELFGEESYATKKAIRVSADWLRAQQRAFDASGRLKKSLEEETKAQKDANKAKLAAIGLSEFKETYKLAAERAKMKERENQQELDFLNNLEKEEADRIKRTNEMSSALVTLQNNMIAVELPDEEEFEDLDQSIIQMGERLVGFRELAKDISEGVTQALNDSAQAMAVGIGMVTGAIAAGAADAGDLGNMVIGVLADLAIQVGTIAVSTGIAVAGIKASLESLNPVLAVAAGIALIALGSYAKNKLSAAAEAPKLAGGGLAYGETLATVGDNRNAGIDPEVIAPLSKLENMLGGSSVNVTGRIQGRDLVLANERGSYSRRRAIGKR